MELSKVEQKKEKMNEPSSSSNVTNSTDETDISKMKFMEDLILDSFITCYAKDTHKGLNIVNLLFCNENMVNKLYIQ